MTLTRQQAIKEMTPFAGRLPKGLEKFRSKIVDYDTWDDAFNGRQHQVYLVVGWRRDDDLVHSCIGDTIKEIVEFCSNAVPCDCDDCQQYIDAAGISPGHGGARPGAGRKKGGRNQTHIDPQKRRARLGIRLPQEMIDWLKAQDMPAGRVIENAVNLLRDAGR